MPTPLKQSIRMEEYKAKWEYVRHTESLQAKHIQWYFAVVGAVLAYLYGKDTRSVAGLFGGPWIPMLVLTIYSILTNLRLLLQKKNYETYTARLRFIEGQETNGAPIHHKVLSVFKIQYYSVVLVGSVVAGLLFQELTQVPLSAILASLSYLLAMVTLSFSPIIGGTSYPSFQGTVRDKAAQRP